MKAIAAVVVATIIAVSWAVPLLTTVFTAFKSMEELLLSPSWVSPPRSWRLDAFVQAWSLGGLGRYLLNTCIIAVPSTLLALFLSTLSAHALSRYEWRLATPLLMLFLGGNLVPFQVLLIPVFRFANMLGTYDTYWSVILMHTAFQVGFCTFFLRNFMRTLPASLYDAARVDGAGELTIYFRITLPLVVPALAALGILVFTWVWNDYLWSLVLLQSDRYKPITLGLTVLRGQWIAQWNIIAAGALVAVTVPIIVFLLFQRYFVEGLTLGAIKG